MNKHKINIGIFAIMVFMLAACSEKILDKSPLNSYSDATVWANVNLAHSYLNNCYYIADIGYIRYVMLGTVSDEMFTSRGSGSDPYNVGTMTADRTNGNYGINWYPNSSWDQFANIQKINLFLDNIDKVADAYKESEKVGIKVKTDVLKKAPQLLQNPGY